ncbi:MAG: hypothetical protein ACD_73C00229G0001 [uncultured bacterium]|nr:MAG: hypothetical protein ACD_73C00229G0001 [uncultured bacterium]
MKRQNRHIGLALFVFLFSLIFSDTTYAAQFHRTQVIRSIPLTIIIKAPTSKRDPVFKAMQNTFETADIYFDLWSLENKAGDIYKINHSAGIKPVKVQANTLELIQSALLLNQQTKGVFDILYPTPRRLRKYNATEIIINTKQQTVFLPNPQYKIDSNGIAKGQILDILSQQLDSLGFKKYLINAGGDLKARGSWPVCLKSPMTESTDCVVSFRIKNKAVMTSGNYERGVHIFNPKEPHFKPKNKSTTVVGKKAGIAGPLAVVLFIKPEFENEFITFFKLDRVYQQTDK